MFLYVFAVGDFDLVDTEACVHEAYANPIEVKMLLSVGLVTTATVLPGWSSRHMDPVLNRTSFPKSIG